jgi:hypothetical protein
VFHELLECRFVKVYYCLPDFLLFCTYIDKTSDTCGTAVKFSKDEVFFVSLSTNSTRFELSYIMIGSLSIHSLADKLHVT